MGVTTAKALHDLYQTSRSLPATSVPVSTDTPSVKKQMQILTELTFIYVLKLLGIEDEKQLSHILSRLRTGTLFYDFTVLAHNLAKAETDFDFLTSPENLPAYAKIAEISEECDITLLPYVRVLGRIADNKQYGLYYENQEVVFFLDEYHQQKDSVDVAEFLHQFKKVLKYRTQKIFERFIADKIFSLIQQTLEQYPSKFSSTQVLALYVYCLHYYDSKLSNAEENFLHQHIKFCVDYLFSHNEITFHPSAASRLLPAFTDDEQALSYLFSHDSEVSHSADRFIGLLKDIWPTAEAIEFCDFLRTNLRKQNPDFLEANKAPFTQILATKIIEKQDETRLYKNISLYFPQKFVCYRSPDVHGTCLTFYNASNEFLFHADSTGVTNHKLPKPDVPILVEVYRKNEITERVMSWSWKTLWS